ncbi:MAG: hypothetical protein MUP76_08375 [Acidimicrobiia bacterium]|nr:hypothetical protein [Acidimicrobiia bacterium]
MHYVLIDLVPALLTWEGRDSVAQPEAREGALQMVDDLYNDFRLAAVADGDRPASAVREALERLDMAVFFDSIGTSSVFGPTVTPRVVRRITSAIGGAGHSIVVTARTGLADALHHAGIPVVSAGGDVGEVGKAVRRLAYGRVNP